MDFTHTSESGINIREIPFCEPVSVFDGLHLQKWAILFDSALQNPQYGRYSYIAIEPFQVLWAKDGRLTLNEAGVSTHDNPFHCLKDLLAETHQPYIPGLPPFQGGAAGAFSYDLYQYLENIPAHALDDTHFPDMAVGFYDVVISFDHLLKKAWIISTGLPEKCPEKRAARAARRLDDVLDLMTRQKRTRHQETPVPPKKSNAYPSDVSKSDYMDALARVKEYILDGDIFEANLSHRFSGKMPQGLLPFDVYKRSREKNPAPFSAFINLGDFCVVSASPERFIQLHQRHVETRPIKGTRARGHTPEMDKILADELKNSAKDNAENVMIVDLLRNDLSRVCSDHSVRVTQLCGLESYPAVHHLVSVITGELRPECDAVDLLQATFPGGSITGAPKIRAMEIIAEIEPTRRGIYCGSLGFIGFNGCMDTSIAIRTCTIRGDVVTFQAGGAIVADSCPESEYQETLVKARPFHEVLGGIA